MTNNWMLNVIADLRRFADLNHMPQLAVKLDQAAAAARVEFDLAEARASVGGMAANAETGRTVSGRIAAGQDA